MFFDKVCEVFELFIFGEERIEDLIRSQKFWEALCKLGRRDFCRILFQRWYDMIFCVQDDNMFCIIYGNMIWLSNKMAILSIENLWEIQSQGNIADYDVRSHHDYNDQYDDTWSFMISHVHMKCCWNTKIISFFSRIHCFLFSLVTLYLAIFNW